ncbi:MAG: hypothetical protein GEU79_15475 [Acidimicrobiia bacterium]|nr:hypothetical protein [Acidimicrobiia bacterium]
MISPAPGVVFSESSDGDLRTVDARRSLASRLGISGDWATVRQTHGAGVRFAQAGGDQGESDALITGPNGPPIAVFTADCVGIVARGDKHVAVIHAGWRGIVSGVVESLRREFDERGDRVHGAWIGPSIGPCCYEVGDEVTTRFPPSCRTETTWGTSAVDLWKAAEERLGADEVWTARICTRHESGWWSYRKDGTRSRMAAVAWAGEP